MKATYVLIGGLTAVAGVGGLVAWRMSQKASSAPKPGPAPQQGKIEIHPVERGGQALEPARPAPAVTPVIKLDPVETRGGEALKIEGGVRPVPSELTGSPAPVPENTAVDSAAPFWRVGGLLPMPVLKADPQAAQMMDTANRLLFGVRVAEAAGSPTLVKHVLGVR